MKIQVRCDSCGQEFDMEKFYKRTSKLLDGVRIEYVGRCISCKAEIVSDAEPKYGRVTITGVLPDKPRKRIAPGHFIVGRERWEDIPHDLKSKLEEEARLRAELQKEKDGEDKMEEGSGKAMGTS